MPNFSFLVQAIFARILGYGFAFLMTIPLLFKVLKSPIKFVKTTFYTKREVMPACLNDPSLGQHKYMYLEDVKLHYVISGDEGKPLMLLVHGFPEFWYCWKYQIKEFSKDYRVVAVDMRGYGDSDKPNGVENYHIQKLSADLKQLILALDYKSCVLVGHDWGGAIVWNFLYNYTEMVDRLIVMNGPHPYTFQKYLRSHRSQFKKSWYIMFFQVPLIPELFLSAFDLEAFDMMMANLDKNGSKDEIEAYKYAFSSKGAVQNPINYYRAAFKQPLKAVKLEKPIETPTLVIWGEPDRYLETGMADLGRSDVPNLTVKVIKNSNHFVQTWSPNETNNAMREFLSGK